MQLERRFKIMTHKHSAPIAQGPEELKKKGWMKRRTFLKLAGITSASFALKHLEQANEVWAQEVYPSEKITWIVPVKPGGGVDLMARFLAPQLTEVFKESRSGIKGGEIAIKNVAESGGRRAYSNIFHAKPNGYTIGDFNPGFVTENLTSKPEFDFNKFTFLVRTGASLRVIATKRDGFRNWDEMMRAAKEKEIKWAAGNFNRSAHIDSIMTKEAMSIPARLINFPGTAESVNAILRGDVHVGLFSLDSIYALVKAKELQLLMVFSDKNEFAGVPSVKDLGHPELADTICYHRVIVAPPNLPKEIANTIIAAFKKVLSRKDVIDWAERTEFTLSPFYGAEAEKLTQKVMNYYIQMTPTLLKYLK